KRIFITGINTPTTLTFTCLLHIKGYIILAVDYKPIALLSPTYILKAVIKFY
ncbi:hypothetical protein V2W45_1244630, partial [Cenococcum geophilum]